MKDVRAWLTVARAQLPGDDAQLEAELLLAHALNRTRTGLFARPEFVPDAAQVARFESLLQARRGGQPIAYLLGRRGFWSLDLAVSPAVLIPRPETELLVELALARIPLDGVCSVADLGTGSGAIALALAVERPAARIVATDASADALAMARANAAALGLSHIEFRQGDWCGPLEGAGFDIIVSNPPYIAADDVHVGEGDLRFEPRAALVSGADGLDAIRNIAATAPMHLASGGWLLLEHGWDQGAAVRALLREQAFTDVETVRDLGGRDRVSLGRLPAG